MVKLVTLGRLGGKTLIPNGNSCFRFLNLKLLKPGDFFGRFLVEEWKFLRQGEVIWENLPRRIDENIIQVFFHLPEATYRNVETIGVTGCDCVCKFTETTFLEIFWLQVPQQRNEYDCSLFVLFFMEHFFDEVHRRVKKKDFTMFGRRWFKPAEASCLRMKIRRILEEEFKNVSEND
uniref:Ubiquitin-like protease family profile domain-containing protein n=1 Tax=Solanum lycopersicum TaxID=4081 RepID=A0A3Q7G3H2_SOLLC